MYTVLDLNQPIFYVCMYSMYEYTVCIQVQQLKTKYEEVIKEKSRKDDQLAVLTRNNLKLREENDSLKAQLTSVPADGRRTVVDKEHVSDISYSSHQSYSLDYSLMKQKQSNVKPPALSQAHTEDALNIRANRGKDRADVRRRSVSAPRPFMPSRAPLQDTTNILGSNETTRDADVRMSKGALEAKTASGMRKRVCFQVSDVIEEESSEDLLTEAAGTDVSFSARQVSPTNHRVTKGTFSIV